MVKLPINETPPFIGYSSHAKALAILSTTKEYLPWFYNNYIQLCCKIDFHTVHDVPLDFYLPLKKDCNYYLNNPLLFSQVIRKSVVETMGQDIVAFFKNCLDRGFYIDTFLNELYIPERIGYRRSDYFHDNLLYGYDDEREVFYLAGYSQFSTFVASICTYNELRMAYASCPEELWYKCIYLYHIELDQGGAEAGERFSFDIGLFKLSLSDYLHSINSSQCYATFNNPTQRMKFGLEIYDSLIENFSTNLFWEDLRPLHILWEHKKGWMDRVSYLHGQGFLNSSDYERVMPQFEYLCEKSLQTRNLQIKRMIKNKNYEESIFKNIDEIKQTEARVIQDLLSII